MYTSHLRAAPGPIHADMQPGIRTRRTTAAVAGCLIFGLMQSPGLSQSETRLSISPQGPAAGSEFISSADVLARVEVLREELELIRSEMGQPPPVRLEITVREAAPRETYFHAYTLSDKAHRLAFEFTGRPERPLGILLAAETTPVNVYAVVSEALESIRAAKRALRIEQRFQETRHDPNTTSSEVLRAIIQANRELNNLLYQEYSATDVYEQVSTAINFATRLLEEFPDDTPAPALPPFESAKTSADVFHRLVTLFDDIKQIADYSGESALELKVWASIPSAITPSDAHDIARMVFAELAYFYSLLKDPKPVDEPKYPAHRILPSHVYQQVGVLQRQLDQLKTLSATRRDWLKRN